MIFWLFNYQSAIKKASFIICKNGTVFINNIRQLHQFNIYHVNLSSLAQKTKSQKKKFTLSLSFFTIV